MNSTFDVLLFGLVGVEYALHLDAPAQVGTTRRIESETREAGGLALLTAIELSKRGARVALCGNPIGEDSNGRLVTQTLQTHGIEFLSSRNGTETPYWVKLCARETAVLTRIVETMSTVEFRVPPEGRADTPFARIVADDGYWACAPLLETWACEIGALFVAASNEEKAGREVVTSEVAAQFAARIWAQIN